MRITSLSFYLLLIWLLLAVGDAIYRLFNYVNTRGLESTFLSDLWLGASIILIALFIWELTSFRGVSNMQVKRKLAHTIPVNHFCKVELGLQNPLARMISIEVYEHTPSHCVTRELPLHIKIKAKSTVNVTYQLKSLERGDLNLQTVEVWFASELGLLQHRVLISCKNSAKVYPNYRSIINYTLLATEQRTRQLGIRQRQQRGDGLEFHQLREYRVGDSLRQIDWRATSRLRKIISKDYQQERDQNIIFLLDSGRRMRAKDGDLSHFDQALNATLLVSSIALRQGDAVGLKVFGGVSRFIPPRKGASTISAMLNNVYDLHPTHHASDLIEAAESLNAQFKKRSLIVIVSNVRVEDSIELKSAVKALKKHHLVMLANLKEQILEETLDAPIIGLEDAFKFSQTVTYLQQRDKLLRTLVHEGVLTLDSTPSHLAVNMVNKYFDVKRSGQL